MESKVAKAFNDLEEYKGSANESGLFLQRAKGESGVGDKKGYKLKKVFALKANCALGKVHPSTVTFYLPSCICQKLPRSVIEHYRCSIYEGNDSILPSRGMDHCDGASNEDDTEMDPSDGLDPYDNLGEGEGSELGGIEREPYDDLPEPLQEIEANSLERFGKFDYGESSGTASSSRNL